MKQVLLDLFTSKKFLAALTAIAVYVAGRFGFNVDPTTLDHIWQGLLFYVGAQAIADHGKSAALVRAAAPVAVPSALLSSAATEMPAAAAAQGTAVAAVGTFTPGVTPASPLIAAPAAGGGEIVGIARGGIRLPRDPQTGSSFLAVLIALTLGGVAAAVACTATQARHTAAAGLVAALDCEAAHLDAAALADARALADAAVQRWIGGTAPADLGQLIDRVKADLAPLRSDLGRCAVAGAIAAATTALAAPAPEPGTAVSALSAPGPDPAAVRAAFATAARELGWPPVKVAGGTVL